jgi:hypothetical protein
MIDALLVLGLLLFAGSVWVLVRLFRQIIAERTRARGVFLTLPLGTLLGIAAAMIVYPVSPTARLVGFPFPAAIWELHDGIWMDYVGGCSTLLAMVGDFVIGFALPHAVWLFLVRKRTDLKIGDLED